MKPPRRQMLASFQLPALRRLVRDALRCAADMKTELFDA